MGTSTQGYTLIASKTPFIQWTDLWHIIVVSVAAGAGLALAFGVVLLGSEFVQAGKTEGRKATGWLLGLLASLFCLAAVGLGIYAMVNPAPSKPSKVVPSSSVKSSMVPTHQSRVSVRHRDV